MLEQEATKPTALITGASSGIGFGIAKHFAGLGYHLTIGGKEPLGAVQEILTELSLAGAASVRYDNADMRDAAAVRKMVEEAHDEMGGLYLLVNNAGIQHVESVEAFPEAAWQAVIDINLSAPFHASAAAIPFMKKAGKGRIVNIASVHGLVASANKSAYVAAKHGIVGLTKTTSLELADTNITCNAIAPAWVLTPLVAAQIEARAAKSGLSFEEESHQLVSEKQPNGRFITPEEIAQMIGYLASAAARSITGSTLTIDGGWTAQ